MLSTARGALAVEQTIGVDVQIYQKLPPKVVVTLLGEGVVEVDHGIDRRLARETVQKCSAIFAREGTVQEQVHRALTRWNSRHEQLHGI